MPETLQARRRRWWPWAVGAGVLVIGGAALLAPRKTEVQVGSVVTAYPSQQYAQLTASGYVVAQHATGRGIARRMKASNSGTVKAISPCEGL